MSGTVKANVSPHALAAQVAVADPFAAGMKNRGRADDPFVLACDSGSPIAGITVIDPRGGSLANP